MNNMEEFDEFLLKEWQNNPKNWKLGIFYFNRKDKRLFPPKRFGFGWTLNFANPFSILSMIGIVVVLGCMVMILKNL